MAPMTTLTGRDEATNCFFALDGYQPLTREVLKDAGLPGDRLAAMTLSLARVSRAGKWHLAPSETGARTNPDQCPQLLRSMSKGRSPTSHELGLLSGFDLCGSCASRLRVPEAAGTYLRLAQWLLAAGAWVGQLETAARSADWPAIARWTAQTPFCDLRLPAMIEAVIADSDWAACGTAARTAWYRLRRRADVAWELARQTAGPPGLRAHAASACALVGASAAIHAQSQLIDSIPARAQPWRYLIGADAWRTASQAWLAAIALDADTVAARAAILGAVEERYGNAPVRDVSLLPAQAACPPDGFSSPASWASAEYRLLRRSVVEGWCDRLENALTDVQWQAADPRGQWQLLGVSGWPLTDERDRELAYLGFYPEVGRNARPRSASSSRRAHPTWTVALHVPSFVAQHATAHDSPHFRAVPGPRIPPGGQPDPAEVSALLRRVPHTPAAA
ncbi:MAG TPA: hypothetical protein VFQ44_07550 [Streptosporangiaceae bacterium]|nr:hypothetical protein [Streptosporangiaceae bacterium]